MESIGSWLVDQLCQMFKIDVNISNVAEDYLTYMLQYR